MTIKLPTALPLLRKSTHLGIGAIILSILSHVAQASDKKCEVPFQPPREDFVDARIDYIVEQFTTSSIDLVSGVYTPGPTTPSQALSVRSAIQVAPHVYRWIQPDWHKSGHNVMTTILNERGQVVELRATSTSYGILGLSRRHFSKQTAFGLLAQGQSIGTGIQVINRRWYPVDHTLSFEVPLGDQGAFGINSAGKLDFCYRKDGTLERIDRFAITLAPYLVDDPRPNLTELRPIESMTAYTDLGSQIFSFRSPFADEQFVSLTALFATAFQDPVVKTWVKGMSILKSLDGSTKGGPQKSLPVEPLPTTKPISVRELAMFDQFETFIKAHAEQILAFLRLDETSRIIWLKDRTDNSFSLEWEALHELAKNRDLREKLISTLVLGLKHNWDFMKAGILDPLGIIAAERVRDRELDLHNEYRIIMPTADQKAIHPNLIFTIESNNVLTTKNRETQIEAKVWVLKRIDVEIHPEDQVAANPTKKVVRFRSRTYSKHQTPDGLSPVEIGPEKLIRGHYLLDPAQRVEPKDPTNDNVYVPLLSLTALEMDGVIEPKAIVRWGRFYSEFFDSMSSELKIPLDPPESGLNPANLASGNELQSVFFHAILENAFMGRDLLTIDPLNTGLSIQR